MSDCPTIQRLEDFVTGVSSDHGVRAHLEACGACRTLLAKIRQNNALLAEVTEAAAQPAATAPSTQRPAGRGSELALDAIEGYQILSEISRGGQGAVYQAIQQSTRRKVALKVLLQGALATSRQRVRFEREIELVAGLQHPNIVTIHDSGRTPDGRHYFAMEYIDGAPLDNWLSGAPREIPCSPSSDTLADGQLAERDSSADRPFTSRLRQLSVADKLRLFIKICDAVNYAHQRGVIHRDLKPANVLIDAAGEPHVLDFGLAKPIGPEVINEGPPVTMTGDFLGTLAYASPEQLRGDPSLVDIRSDVYSLGVMLYETLTGQHPYPITGPMAEIVRNIAEVEPEPPGSWYRGRHRGWRRRPAGEKGAAGRSAAPHKIDGEVETIVLKALAKDTDRRYQSAENLARDIRHYLSGQPLDAKRDSGWYVLRKALRRYRAAVTVAASFVLLAIGFGIFMTVMYQRALAAEELADTRRVEAVRQAAIAEAVNEFLKDDMLGSIDPRVAQGREVTVREVLDQAAEKIEDAFPDEPLVEAAIRKTIGNTYRSLGKRPEAEAHLRAALETRRRLLGEHNMDTLTSMNDLALLLKEENNYEEAEPLYRLALEATRRIRGEEHVNTLIAMNNLAALLKALGKYAEAEWLHRQALETSRRVLGNDDPDTLNAMGNLGLLLKDWGKYDEAERLYRETLDARRRVLGPDHPNTLVSINNLACLLLPRGKYEEAERLLREALETSRRVLSSEHPNTLATMNSFAALLHVQGKYEEAEPLYRQIAEARCRVLGETHPSTLVSVYNLAKLLQDHGKLDEAEPLYRQAVEAAERALPAGHWNTAVFRGGWGGCLASMERYEQAETQLLASYEALRTALGEEHEHTRAALERLISLYDAWGRPGEAGEYRALLPAE